MSELEELKQKVEHQQEVIDAILRVLWHERAELKGQVGKIEKELEAPFKEWLERDKARIPKS